VVDRVERIELLAEAVLRRRGHLRLRQRDIQEAGGVSVAVLRSVEGGRRARPQRHTLRGLDQALGWPPGAAQAVLTASVPPYPGSTVTDLRGYVQELISGDFRPAGELTSEHAQVLRDLPTTVLVAELARRFNVTATVTGQARDTGAERPPTRR
jgi:transcriptional regulator with XRE-family HTH domain